MGWSLVVCACSCRCVMQDPGTVLYCSKLVLYTPALCNYTTVPPPFTNSARNSGRVDQGGSGTYPLRLLISPQTRNRPNISHTKPTASSHPPTNGPLCHYADPSSMRTIHRYLVVISHIKTQFARSFPTRSSSVLCLHQFNTYCDSHLLRTAIMQSTLTP